MDCCGEPHPERGDFYVSAIDPERGTRWLMVGPLATHAAALALLDETRQLCCDADPRGVWLAWGTARHRTEPGEAAPRGRANELLGIL